MLSIAERGVIAILCKNYIECNKAVANLTERVDVGFGDGMHHAAIEDYMRSIAKFMEHDRGRKRFIFATQNPMVFDNMHFESVEDVRDHILLVRNDELVHMTELQAQEFFGSYKAGVQYVSEILRVQGLW